MRNNTANPPLFSSYPYKSSNAFYPSMNILQLFSLIYVYYFCREITNSIDKYMIRPAYLDTKWPTHHIYLILLFDLPLTKIKEP